jgi:hypothetical protein
MYQYVDKKIKQDRLVIIAVKKLKAVWYFIIYLPYKSWKDSWVSEDNLLGFLFIFLMVLKWICFNPRGRVALIELVTVAIRLRSLDQLSRPRIFLIFFILPV